MEKPDFEKMAHVRNGPDEHSLFDVLEFYWRDNGLDPDAAYSRAKEQAERFGAAAFNAGLQRAGHIAHNHGQYSMAYVEDEPPADVVTHNHACWAIRDAIRAEAAKMGED